MKRYTKADMEKFRHDEFGNLICPKGDYSQIHSFGAGCSFGKECIFGNACSFGKECVFENGKVKNGTYFACDMIGSERRKTYFFRDGDGNMFVREGYWFSPLDEFIERVKEAHGGTKYEKEYLAAVELAKIVLEG